MNFKQTFRYPTLAAFERKAKASNKRHPGLMDLTEALHVLRRKLNSCTFIKLVNDLGHGFNHAFFVVDLVLDLAGRSKPPAPNRNLLACGALLHDVCAVDGREEHERAGSRVAGRIVAGNPDVFCEIDARAVAYIVGSHNNQKFMSKKWAYPAKLVRDADTLHEGLDLGRIVWVCAQHDREFYSPKFGGVDRRLFVLSSECREITEADDCDALMFLLRNVTKSIDPGWFATDAARDFVTKEQVENRNKRELFELIRTYVTDPGQQETAKELVNEVMREYW